MKDTRAWGLGSAFIVAWVGVAFWQVRLPVLLAVSILVMFSVFTVLVDAIAEHGSKLPLNPFVQRTCVTVQWTLAAFYLLVEREVIFPDTSSEIIEGTGLFLVLLTASQAAGSAVALRRDPKWTVRSAAFSFVLLLFFIRLL